MSTKYNRRLYILLDGIDNVVSKLCEQITYGNNSKYYSWNKKIMKANKENWENERKVKQEKKENRIIF